MNHLVVVDGGMVGGLLTPADVLRRLLDHADFLNEHMRDYVSTAGYLPPDDDLRSEVEGKTLTADSAAL